MKKTLKKLIFWIFVFIVILVTLLGVRGDISTEYSIINASDVPYSEDITLNITLTANATLFIERIDNESRLNVAFDDEINFTSSVEEVLFKVNITHNFIENITLISLFNLTSTENNNSYLYSIIYDVIFDGDDIVTTVSEEYLTLIKGNYYKNITTDLLPKQESLLHEIAGLNGTVLNITCEGSWISCPKNLMFDDNNRTTFYINYSIPVNAPLGEMINNVTFQVNNITIESSIVFNIYMPDLTYTSYVWTEKCFKKSEDGILLVTDECVQEYEEHNLKRLRVIIDRLREQYNYSVCNDSIEYVIQGSYDLETWDLYDGCKSDLEKCRSDSNTCESQRNELNTEVLSLSGKVKSNTDELISCNTKLISNESSCLAKTFEQSVNNELEARKIKKSILKSVFGWIGLFIALLVVCILGYYWLYSLKKEGAWG